MFWDYSDSAEYRYEQIAERFGVRPERMADYLALRGDSVDNVPGVPGVGPKTAAALMGLFASLDELFERLDAGRRLPLRGAAELPQRLRMHREAAYLARRTDPHRLRCADRTAAHMRDLQRRRPGSAADRCVLRQPRLRQLLRRQAERLTAHTRPPEGGGRGRSGLLDPDLHQPLAFTSLPAKILHGAIGIAGLPWNCRQVLHIWPAA